MDFLTVNEEREIKVDNDDVVWTVPPADAYFPFAPCKHSSATMSVSHDCHSRDNNACSHLLRLLSGLPLALLLHRYLLLQLALLLCHLLLRLALLRSSIIEESHHWEWSPVLLHRCTSFNLTIQYYKSPIHGFDQVLVHGRPFYVKWCTMAERALPFIFFVCIYLKNLSIHTIIKHLITKSYTIVSCYKEKILKK